MKSNSIASSGTVSQKTSQKRSEYLTHNYSLPNKNISSMLPSQDDKWRRELKKNARISGTLVLLTLGLMFYESEQSLWGSHIRINPLRITIVFMCVAEGFLVYQHHLIKLKEKKYRKEVYSKSSLWQDKRQMKFFMLDLMISLVCVPPFVSDGLEDFFLVLCFSKYYLLFKNLVELSPRNTERTNFYCRQFNTKPSLSFILKCYANDLTFFSLIFLWIFFIANFAVIAKTLDREHDHLHEYLWLSGMTQTLVGYGDIVPFYTLGKILSGFNAIGGNFLHSFTLSFLRSYLEFNEDQYKFYGMVKFNTMNLQEEACCLIQCWWRYHFKRIHKQPRVFELQKLFIAYCKFKKSKPRHCQKHTHLKRELIDIKFIVSKQFKVFHTNLKITKDIEVKARASVVLADKFKEKVIYLKSGYDICCLIERKHDGYRSLASQYRSETLNMKRKRDLALKKHILKIPDFSSKNGFVSTFSSLVPTCNYDIQY